MSRRSFHPLALPVIIILNTETRVSNVSLAPCSFRFRSFKKAQRERKQKEEAMCAQVTIRIVSSYFRYLKRSISVIQFSFLNVSCIYFVP